MRAFPATLPKPLPTYTVGFLGKRVPFESESGRTIRRRRTSADIRLFNLEWIFSGEEYEIFSNWFYTSLRDGSLDFDIQLLDDSINEVWYTVSIPTMSYEASLQPAMVWNVRMQVLSKQPSFTDRIPGGTQLQGLASLEWAGTGSLRDRGTVLLGSTALEFVARGQLYTTMRGVAELEFVATGLLPTPLRGTAELAFSLTGRLPAPSLVEIVNTQFNGTDGQTVGVTSTGTLGGTWSFVTGARLSTAQAQSGSASCLIDQFDGLAFLNRPDYGPFGTGFTVELEFYIYVTSASAGSAFGAFVSFVQSSFEVYFETNGGDFSVIGTSGAVGAYSYNSWHKVKVVFTQATTSGDVYINDVLVVSGIPYPASFDGYSFRSVAVGSVDQTSGHAVYWDNLKVRAPSV